MNWIQLDSEEKIDEIKKKSFEKRVFIFKFSSRVVTAIIIRNLLEREWSEGEMNMDTYFLDSSGKPELDKKVSAEFGSQQYIPQGLIIEKSKCIFSVIDGNIKYSVLRDYSNPKKMDHYYGKQAGSSKNV